MKLLLSSQYDFLPRFFGLAVANILSCLMEPLAGAISAGFLGHIEEIRHLTGTALAGTLFNLIYFGMYFLRQSTTGVTAQAVGRGDRSEECSWRCGTVALLWG